MESSVHLMGDLFQQLGLADDARSIECFIDAHRPLPDETHVVDAEFWTPTQSQFLREKLAEDGDWSGLVDSLGSLLS